MVTCSYTDCFHLYVYLCSSWLPVVLIILTFTSTQSSDGPVTQHSWPRSFSFPWYLFMCHFYICLRVSLACSYLSASQFNETPLATAHHFFQCGQRFYRPDLSCSVPSLPCLALKVDYCVALCRFGFSSVGLLVVNDALDYAGLVYVRLGRVGFGWIGIGRDGFRWVLMLSWVGLVYVRLCCVGLRFVGLFWAKTWIWFGWLGFDQVGLGCVGLGLVSLGSLGRIGFGFRLIRLGNNRLGWVSLVSLGWVGFEFGLDGLG